MAAHGPRIYLSTMASNKYNELSNLQFELLVRKQLNLPIVKRFSKGNHYCTHCNRSATLLDDYHLQVCNKANPTQTHNAVVSQLKSCLQQTGVTVSINPVVLPTATGQERIGDLRATGIAAGVSHIIDATVAHPGAYAQGYTNSKRILFAANQAANNKRRHYNGALQPTEQVVVANMEYHEAFGGDFRDSLPSGILSQDALLPIGTVGSPLQW